MLMKLIPLHYIPVNTRVDFIGSRWIGFGISILLTLACFFMLYTKGLNWGIDFTGGALMEIRTEQAADLGHMREALEGQGFGEVSLQHFGSERDVIIRIQAADTAESGNEITQRVKERLAAAQQGAIEYRNIEFVGPTVGKELVRNGAIATVLACLGIMSYVWFRFEWQFGVGTVLALAHDTIMILGFFAVTRFDFGLTAVAAVLTIIGYSVNDSVVIYDRIRENMRRFKKMSTADLINLSMNETLARTLLTSVTVLLASVSLGLLGGDVLAGFSWSLAFGVLVGTYSSIYISAPTLIYLNLRPDTAQPVT